MYKYVGDISKIYQNIIKCYCNKFETAVDATLGNGYDTDFLSDLFQKVYSFDIQEIAIKNYNARKKDNTNLICASHENISSYITNIDCIVYNLGFLPGGDKSITTKDESTLKSIKDALSILNAGGLMAIAIYHGHEEGKKEKEAILNLITSLPKNEFGVLLHSFVNRSDTSPILVIIEKNLK